MTKTEKMTEEQTQAAKSGAQRRIAGDIPLLRNIPGICCHMADKTGEKCR